jgi:hypothetical protein
MNVQDEVPRVVPIRKGGSMKLCVVSTSIVFLFMCGACKDEQAAVEPAEEEVAQGEPEAKPKGDPLPPKKEVDLSPMVSLDLTAAGLKATLQAPGNAVAKDSFGTVEVKVGDGGTFYLEIDEGAPDLAGLKKNWQENDMQKLQKILVESDEVLIVETEFLGKRSFWLDARIPFGEEMLHCKSGRGAPSFSQGQINRFLVACQSLKPFTKVEVEIEYKKPGDLGKKTDAEGTHGLK